MAGGDGMKNVRRVPALAARARAAHKGDCGRVLVLAGSDGMLGAAMLCATAAQRGGAGLVRVALPKALMAPFTIAVPCATTLPRTAAVVARAVLDNDAIVMGPGLGATAATTALVANVLAEARVPVVLDADALNVVARPRRGVDRRALHTRASLVLTPHPGEAARLLGTTAKAVQQDRRGALAGLCQRSGAVVVLKGAGTLVGDGERCYENPTGNPGLATGGAGDVLTGLLGAFLAEGVAPFDAACAAVHWHGKAADLVAGRLSERGLIASDLPLAIAEVLP
ncbi:MAG: NAD(P)H-hydrate dehydratase [Planctomycetes bacterium]|nr:NAD(P)H-hydrate dehydratase [Planctomycetota bacterium]